MLGTLMAVTVKVDAQGRVVIPLAERRRLGLADGGTIELVPTPEGVLLERRNRASVTTEPDGMPVITLESPEEVANADAVDAIHTQRDDR